MSVMARQASAAVRPGRVLSIHVGLSDSGGEPTIDVWLNPATPGPNRLPESLHGIGVRVLDSGGSCPES